MIEQELRKLYSDRLPLLEATKDQIVEVLQLVLNDVPRIDQITGRVKDLDKFTEKAFRSEENGSLKYHYPLEEIQDQIGCRVVVYFLSDVDPVADRVLKEFHPFEHRIVEEQKPDQFSYRARHFVCQIPIAIRDQLQPPINVFELQISTLFQHAWAEANHDLGYKSPGDLSWETRRFLAFTAAQAWGADTIFEDIRQSLKKNS